MKNQDINYVELCRKENKMILQRNHNTFESMTLSEYNFHIQDGLEDIYKSWDEVNDDSLYSPDEFMEYFKNEDEIYFV